MTKELRKEKFLLLRYLDIVEVIIVVIGANQKIKLINRKGCEILGVSQIKAIGKNWFDAFIPKKNRKETRAVFLKLISGKVAPVEYFENPILTKGGKERLIAWHNNVLRDESGKIIATISSGEDITERKIIEEERKQAELFYRTLFEESPDGVVIVDPHTARILEFNDKACKQLGYTRQEFKKLRVADVEAKETPKEIKAHIEKIMREGEDAFETLHRRKNGEPRNVLVWIKKINVSGKELFLDVYHDITEHKEAEIVLHESREDLKRAQAVAHTGSWRLDVRRNKLLWSDETHRIFGIPKSRYLTYEVFLARVHPDDKEYVDRNWKAALRGEPYDIEHRIVVAGKIKWIRERAEVEFDRRGKLRGGFGTCQDITERKHAEESLQRAHDELELKVAQRTAELAEVNKHILYRNEILKLIGTKSSRKEFLEAVIEYLKGWSGCRCLGIRVLDAEGRIPYDAYTGFSREFWESENWLSIKEDQCACIRVIKGKPEPQDLPAMTKAGSFYSSNAKKFEDNLSAHAKTRFRGVCVRSGFRSLAVIPIRNRNETYGAIHFADPKEGVVSLKKVEFLESLTGLIGEGINKFNLEDKIHKDHAILDAFFKHAVTPFVFLDPEFNFIRVNEAYARACRRDVSEFPGHNHFEFYPHEENERIFRQVVQAKAPFQAFAKPFTFPEHPEWGATYWDWTLVPILDNKGEVEFLVFSLKDVTERKLAEEKLSAAQKELESARRLSDIGVLAATVAHELRNPLGVIRTAAYNIKRKAQNPSLDSHLINIEKKILESDQIINNLLFYARLKIPHYENVRIYDILNECIESAKLRFSEHKTPLIKKINSLRRDIIDADPLQITELVNNILNNAYDACLREDCTIEIKGEKDNKGNIEIVFKDNGIGMDEGHIKRAFEPFFSTKAKGTGLGLTVCSQIVNLHGGKICIDSKKGSGTTVTVTIPIKMSANAKENPNH